MALERLRQSPVIQYPPLDHLHICIYFRKHLLYSVSILPIKWPSVLAVSPIFPQVFSSSLPLPTSCPSPHPAHDQCPAQLQKETQSNRKTSVIQDVPKILLTMATPNTCSEFQTTDEDTLVVTHLCLSLPFTRIVKYLLPYLLVSR